jgi:hypothetical protein
MYATLQDVQLALSLLTPAEHVRLLKAARAKIGGTAFQGEPQDLVVPFVAYLRNTMRGIASDARARSIRHPTQSLFSTSEDQDGDSDIFGSLGLGTPSAEDICLEEEEVLLAREQGKAIRSKVLASFEGDEDVLWIIRGIEQGLSARNVQTQAGMTKTRYESAHKRWRRGLGRLFPERGAG